MPQKKYTEEEARERKNQRQKEYSKRTGYKSNHDYDKKTYTQILIRVKKDIAEEYKAKCNDLGIPYSQPLHEAIENFLKENKNNS